MEEDPITDSSPGRSKDLIDSLVHYLPLGYLYLLLLGIASDSIYYGILGVNIISYSNVLDVLLSPVAHLTSGLLFPSVILAIITFGYFYIKLIVYYQQKSKKPNSTKKTGKSASLPFIQQWLFFMVFSIFCAFLGFGIGGGYARKDQLENQKVKINHKLTFQNNTVKDVALIGSNSSYIFYALKDDKVLKITPIQNVLIIERLLN